ncbi:MAG: serine aminopeptidase domain-containing protein [Gemmatimonadota bacterium]
MEDREGKPKAEPFRGREWHSRPPSAVVIFIQGTGEDQCDSVSHAVAGRLKDEGMETFFLDLSSHGTGQPGIPGTPDLDSLSLQVAEALDGLQEKALGFTSIGLFGSGGGGAVALRVAALRPESVRAVVCHGGPSKLTREFFPALDSPVLFISGPEDLQVLEMYQEAVRGVDPEVSPTFRRKDGDTHLFQEEGGMEQVCLDAGIWFQEHLDGEDPVDQVGGESRQGITGPDYRFPSFRFPPGT